MRSSKEIPRSLVRCCGFPVGTATRWSMGRRRKKKKSGSGAINIIKISVRRCFPSSPKALGPVVGRVKICQVVKSLLCPRRRLDSSLLYSTRETRRKVKGAAERVKFLAIIRRSAGGIRDRANCKTYSRWQWQKKNKMMMGCAGVEEEELSVVIYSWGLINEV